MDPLKSYLIIWGIAIIVFAAIAIDTWLQSHVKRKVRDLIRQGKSAEAVAMLANRYGRRYTQVLDEIIFEDDL